MKLEGLEFEEFAIETDYEPLEVTKFYLKEAKKLKQEAKSKYSQTKTSSSLSGVKIINDEDEWSDE